MTKEEKLQMILNSRIDKWAIFWWDNILLIEARWKYGNYRLSSDDEWVWFIWVSILDMFYWDSNFFEVMFPWEDVVMLKSMKETVSIHRRSNSFFNKMQCVISKDPIEYLYDLLFNNK